MERVNNVWKREGECQVDIVDGDNAAEIAGEQRGLMMTLLGELRAAELGRRLANERVPPLGSPLSLWSNRQTRETTIVTSTILLDLLFPLIPQT